VSEIVSKVINQEVVLKRLQDFDISLFMKREDQIHPFISGNKYRKLKYNILKADEQNKQTLLTFGGAFSNHISAVAFAGKEFDFNRYSRTFNGVLMNIEREENYRFKLFASRNDQDIVKQEFKGRGISGPFFLENSPIEFSEKIWIEIRDRYNPDIVLERKQLNRFTDYDINYEEGFIILHEPLPEFDENLNPEFLIVRYETKALSKNEYIYGIRGEKWIDRVRVGTFLVKEEHPVDDKKLYGVDAYYYKNGFKIVSELAHSEGFEGDDFDPTGGSAFRTEVSYNAKTFRSRVFYKKVTDGFQNPSSTTAEKRYTNYDRQPFRVIALQEN